MAQDGIRSQGVETLLGNSGETIYRSAQGEIAPEATALFDRMNAAASVTWSHMAMGWERRRRPNERLDIGALLGALHLEAHCSEALEVPTVFLHPNTNQLRYDLYAGAVTVRELLPIPHDDRPPLLEAMSEWDLKQERWHSEPSTGHAKLIADWRSWLRSDGFGRASIGSELHGEASILAAASYQIIMALNPGRGLHSYDEVHTLVFPVEREPWRY